MYTSTASRHATPAAIAPQRARRRYPALADDIANEIRMLAELLLGESNALYLTLSASTALGQPAPCIRRFDGFWQSIARRGSKRLRQEQRLAELVQPLLADLASLWPPNARPQSIGLMTDGSGLLFSPDLPSPEIDDWAALLLSDGGRSVELLPFALGSPWSLMTRATNSAH